MRLGIDGRDHQPVSIAELVHPRRIVIVHADEQDVLHTRRPGGKRADYAELVLT